MDTNKRQTVFLWLFVGLLAASTLLLAGLQYRWINEVSASEQDRRQRRLQADIERLARDFDDEISTIFTAIATNNREWSDLDDATIEAGYLQQFESWRESAKHEQLVRRLVRVIPKGDSFVLREANPLRKEFQTVDWPPGWERFRERMNGRLRGDGSRPGPMDGGTINVIEIPRWRSRERVEGNGIREWLAVELDLPLIQKEWIPELLKHHLGSTGPLEYDAEITMSEEPERIVFASNSAGETIGTAADAACQLFRLKFPRGRFGPRGGRGNSEQGRWQLAVRHKQGSLEVAVGRARTRNLALTTAILALMLVTIGALVWLTRRAQQLAYLQMEFVAGVSHELRTPLTVIGTAAFNMGSGIVKFNNQPQLERYGTLIQDQTKKLGAIVEQVLRFAGARPDQAHWKREVVMVDQLVDDALAASAQAIAESGCTVNWNIPTHPIAVIGDATGLQHVLQNLISNAAKYGASGGQIEIAALLTSGNVEISVKDYGMGISKSEAGKIFEPFFRGKKAVADQIHGTGLGLSLAKRIVEGNGGKIFVKSQEGKGSEFIVRLPAAPKESMSEFTDPVN